jgi:hypothetical protein
MLPNFTVVICGAVLTVLMLAVAGSGLIDPGTRTRIGAMPEIGRPMMQGMITEPAARGQFAALETSRRAEELMRLRDLAPAVADPVPTAGHDAPTQPTTESSTPEPSLPSDPAAVPTASPEAEPPAAPEALPAAAAEQPSGTEAAPAPVAIAEPRLAVVTEAAPVPDTVATPATEDMKLAAEPAVESPPVAPPIAPPATAPERVAAAPPTESAVVQRSEPAAVEHSEPPTEPPAVAELSEPPAEPPAPASQQLALAEPDAVPTPEATAKLAARTGEPEEEAPIRRLVPRFVPRLPRIIPALSRLSRPRPALALPRVTPMLARHIYAKVKLEAAKAAAVQKKPVHHMMHDVQHRAHVVSPYRTYSVTSGVQYR